MNLKDRLMDDLKQAMRAQDDVRRTAIRMARAAVQNKEIAQQRELSDQEIQQVILGEVKRRREALALFKSAGRQDIVAREEQELEVLAQYLPQQLPAEEIRPIVSSIIAQVGATGLADLGQVMKQSMAELKGKADGRLVNEIARELLSEQGPRGA